MNAQEAAQARAKSIETLNDLIKDVRIAMLTTVDQDGSLRSRPMATQETSFDGTLWFFTGKSSGKVTEIKADSDVNVAYADPDEDTYVSVSGKARLVHDQDKIRELWQPLLKAWFPEGPDDPEIALLKIDVEKAEYWTSASGLVTVLAGFVKSVVTGERGGAPLSDHEKLTM